MDFASSIPGSPGHACSPLQPVSHNQQRESAQASAMRYASGGEDLHDSTVHEKINQFNSLAIQSKQLERKTADAALKRAMLGREEAETEMRRYRDEVRLLRRQAEEGKERERRVGERLETVMENYGRTKETHAHTQALWEKEIRRARKETFKSQSVLVKIQEELKSCRTSQKAAEEELEREKERSKAREQEAFAARYSLVGIQEQLQQALERVKMLEQERDAFKALAAKNEEDVARIAAEGRLPLPPSHEDPEIDDNDELVSPRAQARVSSISIVDIKSSGSSEAELEELAWLWQWEKQRAERALDEVHFLQVECQLRCCSAAKSLSHSREAASPVSPSNDLRASFRKSKTAMLREDKGSRRSTIFVPAEGIFRTISQAEAEDAAVKSVPAAEPPVDHADLSDVSPTRSDDSPTVYARTPSVDPPDFAKQRTSLLSLLNAPHRQEIQGGVIFNIPTIPGPAPSAQPHIITPEPEESPEDYTPEPNLHRNSNSDSYNNRNSDNGTAAYPSIITHSQSQTSHAPAPLADPPTTRPHTSAAHYAAAAPTTTTVTTKVPLRGENRDPNMAARLARLQRTPSHGSLRDKDNKPTFDVNNPALTPTMTREQALAQIRERRGRARSVVAGVPGAPVPAVTPRRQMLEGVGVGERTVSAPTVRVGGNAVAAGAARR
ncbi:hypothetical protein B0T22DRAFT_358705, partial [Podospora appendiculata]